MIVLRKTLTGVGEIALARFAAKARRAVGLTGEVSVLVTTNREMQRLNRDFRQKDKPTDVLSFPSDVPKWAGDIAISADIARTNGREFGHGTLSEIKILILHGMLHLAGFDHESDSGQMARREKKLRALLKLNDGLIERSERGDDHAATKLPKARSRRKL